MDRSLWCANGTNFVVTVHRTSAIVRSIRGYVKNTVFVPPLPKNLDELESRVTNAFDLITVDTLRHGFTRKLIIAQIRAVQI